MRRPSTSHGSPQTATRVLDDAESDATSQPFSCSPGFCRRNSKCSATVSPSSELPSESPPPPSRFLRKARRPSSNDPVPRTLPYEAPYFAAPPTPFDASYFPRLKRSSGTRHGADGQENDYPSPREPVGADDPKRPESTAKRRSASDYLANPRRATLE